MSAWLAMATWSPYIAGAGIGVLIWTVFLLSDHPLGCSTAFSNTAGMIESAVSKEKTAAMPYYRKFIPAVDWHWLLVVGVIIGGFLSAYLSGSLSFVTVPPMFAAAFGPSVALRLVVALIGGILIGLGARWANGCTSGHGISGTLQLALSSWVAAICFFAGGIIVAGLLYGFKVI